MHKQSRCELNLFTVLLAIETTLTNTSMNPTSVDMVIYSSIAVLSIHLNLCTRLLIGNENLKSEIMTIKCKNANHAIKYGESIPLSVLT